MNKVKIVLKSKYQHKGITNMQVIERKNIF